MMIWEKQKNCKNETLTGDNFYISFNVQSIGSDCYETALCIEKDDDLEFFILDGDFRKEYEQAFSLGLDACQKVYDSLKDEFRSKWSTDADCKEIQLNDVLEVFKALREFKEKEEA